MKLLFALVDDNRAIMVVERMIKTLKRRLVVRRIDQSNTPYKLASDVAEVKKKTLRITPHGISKISPFEGHMRRKPNNALSNVAKVSSPKNLNWENAKHACLDRKNLTTTPLLPEIMHDLQQWSDDEVSVNRRSQMTTKAPGTSKPTTQLTPGAQSKRITDKLNTSHKRIQAPIDRNTKND